MKNNAFKWSIVSIPIIINAVIFLLLSLLHFYWALGGKQWYEAVLPTSANGLHQLNPSTTASLIVALGLLLLAFIIAGNLGLFDSYIRRKYFHYGILIIALLFFLRAVGDFRFMGFFKTVKGTRFGINDTQFFSPLCLFIAFLSVLIFILNRNKPY